MLYKRFLCACLVTFPLAALAKQPPGLEPLPAPPPMPPADDSDLTGAPVQISPGNKGHVEELLIAGKHVIKVTTAWGAVYYLRDDLGQSQGGRRDSLDQGIRIPLWVIKEF